MKGLLGSGHYTYIDREGAPRLKRTDMGVTWQKDGYARQNMADVVLTALNLAKELVDQTEMEAVAGI